MPGPDAYPELILAAAQEEIQMLAHERARRASRRAVRSSRRWPRLQIASWWRSDT